jgi:hypothetical protein
MSEGTLPMNLKGNNKWGHVLGYSLGGNSHVSVAAQSSSLHLYPENISTKSVLSLRIPLLSLSPKIICTVLTAGALAEVDGEYLISVPIATRVKLPSLIREAYIVVYFAHISC